MCHSFRHHLVAYCLFISPSHNLFGNPSVRRLDLYLLLWNQDAGVTLYDDPFQFS